MMTMDEFFAEAKRLGCRMHLDPEGQRAAFDAKDAEIEHLRKEVEEWKVGSNAEARMGDEARSDLAELRAALEATK
jgi:hypothetical protein